jgi:hypothetical protein
MILVLKEPRSGVSKGAGPSVASWFETRYALLTMRSYSQQPSPAPVAGILRKRFPATI